MTQSTTGVPARPAGNPITSVNGIGTDAGAAVVATATAARAAGIAVCPPVQNGTKAPRADFPDGKGGYTWKDLQTTPADDALFARWYGPCQGLGWVCGAVSGGLHVLDFDTEEHFERYRERSADWGLDTLVDRLAAGYLDRTPSGGHHLPFYQSEGDPLSSTKLAMRPAPTEKDPHARKTLIELKAEGGFIIAAPSYGPVHPSGEPYVLLSGSVETIAAVTMAELEDLLALARSFDETPRKPAREDEPLPIANGNGHAAPNGAGQQGERPGDAFARSNTWEAVLRPYGWKVDRVSGEETYWTRPGKDRGVSGTTNYNGSDLFKAFTTSAVFEIDKTYSKFGVYALLAHGGDFRSAAKNLRDQGYGGRSTTRRPSKAGALNGPAEGNGKATGPREEPAKGSASEDRPEIEINTERHRAVEESIKALARDPAIYRRGESLVTVIQETAEEIKLTGRTTLRNVIGSPKIVDLSDAVVSCHLTRNAQFYQWRKDKRGEEIPVDVHPPEWLIKATATRKHWPGIRELSAVVECPFPRPDGSIVETPGYDAETATLYLPTIDFPKIPDKPTRADARAAWGRLRAYVRQFPFPSEDDCVVVLAGILNVIGRPAVRGPVPGTAVIGNRAGTGKGLLVDFMGMPGVGRPVPTSAYPDDKQEASKVKVSIVWSGKPVVSFDNLDEGSTYGGSAIDSMLTSFTIDDRILGLSKNTGDIPVRVVCFLNGNNLAPSKDAWRRWMVINLTTDLEHPERRNDIEDKALRSLVLENRGEIVRDALVILKAHAIAGRPTPGWAPLGSFEEWDRVIRSAVWFATDRDCLATQRQTADDAPDRVAKIAVLEGWRELPGGQEGQEGLTSGEAVALVEAPGNTDRYHTMRGVLVQRGRGGKLASSASLGIILRGLKNTPIGGLRLKDTGIKRHGAVCWVVESTREGEDQGTREDRSSPPREIFRSDSDAIKSGGMCKVPGNGWDGPSPVLASSPTPIQATAGMRGHQAEHDWTLDP